MITFPSGLISSTDYHCQRDGGGNRYKLLEPGGSEGGPGWTTLHMFYAFLGFSVYLYLWIYKLTLLDQTQVSTQIIVFPI